MCAFRPCALAALAASTLGCSLVLQWDPEGEKCAPTTNECLDGYSCLVNRCVANHSLDKGQTCNHNDQCFEGLVCAPSLFTCRAPCAAKSYYEPTPNCLAGEYCQPFLDENRTWVGVCVPGDTCATDGQCSAGEVCVKISATAFTCEVGCQITWNTGSYHDTCGSTAVDQKYCQPLGAAEAERLVCVSIEKAPNDPPLGAVGEVCAPINIPCSPGLACINEICKRHCNPAAGTSGNPVCPGQLCCTRGTGADVYGVCDAACN